MPSQELARKLRQYKIPIFGRVQANALMLDFRTILPGEGEIILQAFRETM